MQAANRKPFLFRLAIVTCLFAFHQTGARGAEEPELLSPEKLPSAWIKTLEARTWAGYKDNVLLGNLNVIGSPLVAGGLDLMFYRLPVDGWEYLVLSSADYTYYPSAPQANPEANALVEGQVKRTFAEGWRGGLSAEYLYFDQVMDSSVIGQGISSMLVEGHTFTLRPSLGKDLNPGYRVELEVPVTRQIFQQFVDSYWEFGPKLVLGRQYGNKSDVNFAYEFIDRPYDTRLQRDAQGDLLPGRELSFYLNQVSVAWRQNWDEGRHWRTTTKLSLLRNDDNGSGYYAYWRPQISEQLRYQARTWEVRLEARAAYYHYDLEHVGGLESPLREKTYFRVNVRGEKTLTKSLKVFAQYEHEQALSNLDLDQYNVNTISAGLNLEF
jgi:hypothetical protein